MKAVIVSGGAQPSRSLIEHEMQEGSLLICADSGANCLYDYGITPDFLVGDFDSIEKKVLNFFSAKQSAILTYPVEKDCTDTELALKKTMELGAKEIVFLGCTGLRLDHTLGNLGLLRICLEAGIKAFIKDDKNTLFLTDSTCELSGSRGDLFSLQAYCDIVTGLSIEGAKYPLNNYDLRIGDPLTISNEFTDSKVKIHFNKGLLLIIYSRD